MEAGALPTSKKSVRSAGVTGELMDHSRWEQHERGDLAPIIQTAMCRVRSWFTPPNWSTAGWLEEAGQIARIAAWEAAHDYDAARGVPFAAYLHLRIVARV